MDVKVKREEIGVPRANRALIHVNGFLTELRA
jgi:hypothetical protein